VNEAVNILNFQHKIAAGYREKTDQMDEVIGLYYYLTWHNVP